MSRFERGASYFATPTLKGAPQRIVCVAARSGDVVTFTLPSEFAAAKAQQFDGREFATIKASDGLDYFVASTTPADLEGAARVVQAIAPKRAARRFFLRRIFGL